MKRNNSRTAIIGLGKTGLSIAKYLKNNNIDFAVYDTRENLLITKDITKYIDKKYIFLDFGYNFIPSEISAAFALEQLKKLRSNFLLREKNFH